MAYCIYLRKSRKDIEAEMQGAGETLARHRADLFALAQRRGYDIGHIYEELGSADTIAARPVMQQLLNDVTAGMWQGVLVFDIARLARGDTMDQALVAQTFRYSNPATLIITPDRIFDPQNDADEEYFEFNLFFARREYKAITRRMQAGRTASVNEGKYVGSVDAYGYERYKLKGEKGWSLRIVPAEAEVVRMIFDLFVNGRDTVIDGHSVHEDMGCAKIADLLNTMSIRTKSGNLWTPSSIRNILRNPMYCGKVRWKMREKRVQMVDGRRVVDRPLSPNMLITDGRHEGIISPELFEAASSTSHGRRIGSVNKSKTLVNPLAGILRCGICGRTLALKPSTTRYVADPFLYCPTMHCKTSSCTLPEVESMLLDALADLVDEFSAAPAPVPVQEDPTPRAALAARLDELEKRRARLMDLLEEGIYDTATYTQRMALLRADIAAATASLNEIPQRTQTPQERAAALLPQLRHVLQAYHAAPTPADKNKLLRSVIDHVDYHKTHRCLRGQRAADYVTLDLFPKV